MLGEKWLEAMLGIGRRYVLRGWRDEKDCSAAQLLCTLCAMCLVGTTVRPCRLAARRRANQEVARVDGAD